MEYVRNIKNYPIFLQRKMKTKPEKLKELYGAWAEMTNIALYKCKHCKAIVKRESEKKWIKSYCDDTQQYVRLMRLPDKDQI